MQQPFNMEQFTPKDGKIIQYENGIATVIDIKELEAQKELIETNLASVKTPTDKELLSWAKANYPMTDTSAAVKELEKINTVLEAVK